MIVRTIRAAALIAAVLCGLVTPTFAAGTINLSLSQQLDNRGRPLAGGLLYFFAAGTNNPQSAYQNSGLTIPHPNPIVLDAAGRVPQFFLADGSIKIRLTDSAGVTQVAADGIFVIGPSGGGGGGGSVDATTLYQTGDLKVRYGTGTHTGFVRANGRTVGSATSGATERANADCQVLFEYLWTTDANLAVSGGRGASANADWVANKTIALPDWRGRAIAALDDMGTAAAGKLTATYFGSVATVLGADGGAESQTMTIAQMPSHVHTFSGTTEIENAVHTHNYSVHGGTFGGSLNAPFLASFMANPTTTTTGNENQNHVHGFSGTTFATGGTNPHPIVQPTRLATIYIKL